MDKKYSMELGGRPLTLEFGKYARAGQRFNVFVRYGDTVRSGQRHRRRHSRARASTFSR